MKAFLASSRRTRVEEILAKRFATLRQNRLAPAVDAPLITIGAPPDDLYYAILGEVVSGLRVHQTLRTEQICTQVLRPSASQSFRRFIRARMDDNWLTRRRWGALYRIFSDRVGYRNTDWSSLPHGLRQWRLAWHLWRSLRDKDQLAQLTHDGIVIGDLVIDTYLRLRPTSSVAIDDIYLLVVIHQAIKDVELAFTYFRQARPSIFFSIYTTYLSHGVPVRVALACGIKVLTFGNLQEFSTPVSLARPHHTKDSSRYSADFDAMPNKIEKARQAAQALEGRLSGRIDAATVYMKKSAYAVATQNVPNVRGATVIFLHDFYDSVHIYSWILFHDFWEWICFTIDGLQAAGQDFWIKPHPNQAAQSSAEIDALRRKYPGAKFLPPDITNRQLADAGMVCAITVYGSVAPEMAFLGIPSISCGDSPHASFDALCLARSRQAYAELLSNPPRLGRQTEQLKAQACAFYYMHNLHLDVNETLLRDRFAAVWAHMIDLQANDCSDGEKTVSVLAGLTGNSAFQHFSDTLFSINPS